MAGLVTIERSATVPAQTGPTLLAFAGEDGVPRAWALVSGGAVIGRGDEVAELPEQRDWVRVVLAVPGTDATIRWRELDEGLTPAQAAAAARLQIGDDTAAPLADLLVAVGRPEAGLTPVALTPAERMRGWVEAARALAMEPDVVIPAPLLLLPPGDGLVRLARDGGASDYRGQARAFSMEPELAALITGDEPIRDLDDNMFEAGLGPALANPAINLRQGVFARRRELVLDRGRIRRLVVLGAILLLVSILIQVVMNLRTITAADKVAAEAQQVRAGSGLPGARNPAPAGRFSTVASALLEAVRETPNAELREMTYQPDGSLRVSLLADAPATIDALRARIAAHGMQAAGGTPSQLGGRAAGEIVVRPR